MKVYCKICNHLSQKFDAAKILGKYDVNYHRCSACGFVQTDEPHWLEEAYSKAITCLDTGIVQRNIKDANCLLFFMKFIQSGICMDFGGGVGMLTRIMRDYGFDFYHYDKYAENIYARGFEADMSKKYTLVTSFENFEHYVNPSEEIDNLLNMTNILFFSTDIIASNPPLIKDWWYYVPVTGQHISFYSLETLKFIAKKHECQLLTNGNNLHILSKTPIRKNFFKLLGWYNKIINKLDITRKFKKESNINKDYETIYKMLNKNGGKL
jgi:2-polyprenyl-3-methyl-5-hydroxy-6-metoxy-1,4-benzoquinol methylase